MKTSPYQKLSAKQWWHRFPTSKHSTRLVCFFFARVIFHQANTNTINFTNMKLHLKAENVQIRVAKLWCQHLGPCRKFRKFKREFKNVEYFDVKAPSQATFWHHFTRLSKSFWFFSSLQKVHNIRNPCFIVRSWHLVLYSNLKIFEYIRTIFE